MDYSAAVENGIMQGWYRVPSLNTNKELRDAIEDIHWQRFRGQRLKGQTTWEKLDLLVAWLRVHESTDYEQKACTQVLNYLDALKRGGFLIEMREGHTYTGPTRGIAGKSWVVAK